MNCDGCHPTCSYYCGCHPCRWVQQSTASVCRQGGQPSHYFFSVKNHSLIFTHICTVALLLKCSLNRYAGEEIICETGVWWLSERTDLNLRPACFACSWLVFFVNYFNPQEMLFSCNEWMPYTLRHQAQIWPSNSRHWCPKRPESYSHVELVFTLLDQKAKVTSLKRNVERCLFTTSPGKDLQARIARNGNLSKNKENLVSKRCNAWTQEKFLLEKTLVFFQLMPQQTTFSWCTKRPEPKEE